jgi:hypothetical protein
LFFSCEEKKKSHKKETTINIENPNDFIGKHKTQIAILGVFHFNNPGLDSYKQKFGFDILSKKRQNENKELIEQLSDFKPTKILVERNRILSDSILNSEFSKYLNNDFDLSEIKSETYQIGFKLAKFLKHKEVFCSDAKADWFGVELDWDNYDDIAYVKSKGQFEKYTRYNYNDMYRYSDSLKTVQTITEHLIYLNHPNNRLKNHQAYLTSIIEGAGDNYLGADNVARWYRRNLRIFSNIYDITDFNTEERLLVIYGAGHVYQLKQFLTDSPDFDYIEINEYLKK